MFNKIRWFLFYRKTIRRNKILLLKKHGVRIDWVNRMYKTYNLTEKDLKELNLYGSSYIDKLLEKDRSKIEEILLELKIHQFVGLMEVEPLNSNQIGVAFRFKHFDTAKIANISIWVLLSIVSMGIVYLINLNYISLIIGQLSVFVLYLITRLFVVNRTTR